jgi:very-short-patch-repair endonuclease
MDDIPNVLDTNAAHLLGFSRHAIAHRLERGRWRRLIRGVYLTNSGVPTYGDWMRAALLWAHADAVVAGLGALRLQRLECGLSGWPLVLLVPRGCSRRSTGQIVVRHTTRLPRPMYIEDFPVAPAARSLVEAGLLINDIAYIRELMAGAAQQRLCTPAMIDDELARAPKRGSALLRRVLREISAGAESVPECEVAEILNGARITGFTQNTTILDRSGRQIGRGDVVWEEERAVLEIDGQQWHAGPAQWQQTMRRHNRLEVAGYAVLHYPPADIRRDPDAFVNTVGRWLVERRRLLTG